jgi:hypothetical protein
MTDLQDELIGENMVLSNRDKAEQSGDRRQDGKRGRPQEPFVKPVLPPKLRTQCLLGGAPSI